MDKLPPLQDNLTPKELGIRLNEGPHFEPAKNVKELLEVPEAVQKEIDRYIDTRIITESDVKAHKDVSYIYKSILSLYRYVTKQYLQTDYLVNYRSESVITENIEKSHPLAKKMINENRVSLLLFLDPQFLGLITVFMILRSMIQLFVTDTQNFVYDDIPASMWYFPMIITRFIGNLFFFLFYFMILLWAGMRRLVNPNVNTPMTLLYMTGILVCLQLIFVSFLFAESGELKESWIWDSVSTVVTYIVPLMFVSYMPNIVDLIPSEFVRKHRKVPILPVEAAGESGGTEGGQPKSIKYSLDLISDTLKCYSNSTFYLNVFYFTLLYTCFTIMFYQFDPSLSTFVRGDLLQLIHRTDIHKPKALSQSQQEKLIASLVYHLATILIISISSISITGLPSPYNNPNNAFYYSLLFAFLLPIGKLLIEFKYRSHELDFYGTSYDFVFTFLRIIIPMYLLTNIEQINYTLAYLLYADNKHPLPSWITYSIIISIITGIALLFMYMYPSKSTEQTQKETFRVHNDSSEYSSSLPTLIVKAKELLQTFQ